MAMRECPESPAVAAKRVAIKTLTGPSRDTELSKQSGGGESCKLGERGRKGYEGECRETNGIRVFREKEDQADRAMKR